MLDFSDYYVQSIMLTVLFVPHFWKLNNGISNIFMCVLYIGWWMYHLYKGHIKLSLKYIVIPIMFLIYYGYVVNFPYMFQ